MLRSPNRKGSAQGGAGPQRRTGVRPPTEFQVGLARARAQKRGSDQPWPTRLVRSTAACQRWSNGRHRLTERSELHRNHAHRARSSAVEHYLDMVGVTGSIPVAPTMCRSRARYCPLSCRSGGPSWRTEKCSIVEGVADEGQKLAQVAARAPPRQPRRTPQGACLCHQQDQSPLQGATGLRRRLPPHSRPAGVRTSPS